MEIVIIIFLHNEEKFQKYSIYYTYRHYVCCQADDCQFCFHIERYNYYTVNLEIVQ